MSASPVLDSVIVPSWLHAADLRVVDSIPLLEDMLADLSSAEVIAFDVETTGLSIIDDKLVAMQFCGRPDRAYFVPIAMHGMNNLNAAEVVVRCGPLWKKGVIGHNVAFDWQIMKRWVDFNILADTLLGVKCYPESWIKLGEFGLKDLAHKYLQREVIDFKDLFPRKIRKAQRRFDLVPLELAIPYACQDVILTVLLYEWVTKHVDTKGMIYRLEHEIIKPVAEMELLGVRLDLDRLKQAEDAAGTELVEMQLRINELAGRNVYLDSTADLRKLLFEELNIPPVAMTGTGLASTDMKSLEKLQGQHEIIDILIAYRNVSKLQVAFLKKLPLTVASDGCIHTSFNQWGAITGRFSSRSPNLQQIPKEREKYGDALRLAIRRSFLPPEGYVGFLDIDYNAVEYRLFASLSQDPAMLQAFLEGKDVHKATAALMFSIPYEEVTKQQRNRGKTINFASLYGQSTRALAIQWNIPEHEAEALVARYWAVLPRAKRYIATQKGLARNQGFCETYFGRRRMLPHINSKQRGMKMMSEREAVNTRVQGTAGDLMKKAIVRAAAALKGGLKSRLALTVHDQLVIAHHPDDELDQLAEAMREAMEIELPDFVPLITQPAYGLNWNDVVEMEYPSRRTPALPAAADGGSEPEEEPATIQVPDPVPVPAVAESKPEQVATTEAVDKPEVVSSKSPVFTNNQLISLLEDPTVQFAQTPPGVGHLGESYLRLMFSKESRREAVLAVASFLMSKSGDVPMVTNVENVAFPSHVTVSVDLLLKLKSMGLSYEMGQQTKDSIRRGIGRA